MFSHTRMVFLSIKRQMSHSAYGSGVFDRHLDVPILMPPQKWKVYFGITAFFSSCGPSRRQLGGETKPQTAPFLLATSYPANCDDRCLFFISMAPWLSSLALVIRPLDTKRNYNVILVITESRHANLNANRKKKIIFQDVLIATRSLCPFLLLV